MEDLGGSFIQQKVAFSHYMIEWFNGLYTDTAALREFKSRKVSQAIQWAPSRMLDEIEKMLAQYRKNENGPKGSTTRLPVVILATDDDFLGTGADWGGQHTGFDLVQILEGGSWYEYKQDMHDRRIQVAIIASDPDTAKSLAAQLSSFMQQPHRRYMDAKYVFGQYEVPAAMTLETKRIDWMSVKHEQKNMKILAGDVALKCIVPILRGPGPGEINDGSTNNPPGFPAISGARIKPSMGFTPSEMVPGVEH
ncbi:hypothetical protein [Pseudomonas gingeri]|uniref:hypothetical protein n=1 Tax=Pseudomonas gingeri TaxID=117681 RepID=UPI0015A49CB9|nr:hypothetical protein [Pseudomonas gingeri]NWA11917.1 hypothetical protein [Pseudomonas gingeri]